MELTTQCPRCRTKFAASMADLQRRKGFIRCVQCAHIFDGFEEIVPDETPQNNLADPFSVERIEPQVSSDVPVVVRTSEPLIHPEPPQQGLDTPQVIRSDRQHFIAPNDDVPPSLQQALAREPAHRIPSSFDRELTEDENTIFKLSDTANPIASDDGDPNEQDDTFYVSDAVFADQTGSEPDHETTDFYAHSDDVQVDEPPPHRHYPDTSTSLTSNVVRLFWWGMLVLLLVLLSLQILYVFRNQVANQLPIMRPVLESLCVRIGCEVSYERRINQIKIVSSSLQVQAGKGDVQDLYNLRIRLRNDDKRPQEWPTLIVTFTDISTAVITRIELDPQRYLTPQQLAAPFGAFDEVEFTLPVNARGKRINGYKIDKYYS